MLHRMMPREAFNRNTISLRVGDVTPIDLLIERLLAAGYTREYMVEGKGQFSVRGGIIDVYPADALSAVRIEFFDDELDSIRAVDVMSQRSQGNMQEVVIPPASEAPVPQAGTEALARLLLEALARQEAVAKGESGKATTHPWRICRWRMAKSPRRRPSPAKTARWNALAKNCARRSARCKTV
ncbi:MAG: hypothetical protein ACLUI3_04885 [Christensenellales bacterium]